MSKQLMTSRDLAERLGCTPAALERMRAERRGPSFLKIGALVRYSESDVEAWLETRRRSSTTDHGAASAGE